MMTSKSTNMKAAAVFVVILARIGWNEVEYDPDVNGIQTGPKVTLFALLLSKINPEVIRALLIFGYVALCVALKMGSAPISVAIKSTAIYAVLATRMATREVEEAPAFFTRSASAQELPPALVVGLGAAAFLCLLMRMVQSGVSPIDVSKVVAIVSLLTARLVMREPSEASSFFATGAGKKSLPIVVNILGGFGFIAFATYAARLGEHRMIKSLDKLGFFSMINLSKFVLIVSILGVRAATRDIDVAPTFFMPSPSSITPPQLLINIAAGFAFVFFAAIVCRLDEHRSIKALSNIGFFQPVNLLKFVVVASILGARLATRGEAQDSTGFFNPTSTKSLESAGLFNGIAGLAFVGFAGKVGRTSEWHPLLHDRVSQKNCQERVSQTE